MLLLRFMSLKVMMSLNTTVMSSQYRGVQEKEYIMGVRGK